MRTLNLLLTIGLLACLAPTLTAQTPTRPNVVVILTDDQGWGDLSAHGNSNLSTPNIDAIGRSGARFDRFYVCPVCSPTRAEFLTGRYHPRGGVYSTSTGGERLDLDERTIADMFKAAGYRTAAFGKWHNGSQFPYHPLARGFEQYYGFTSGHWGDYFNPPLELNGLPTTGKGFLPDDLTDHAIRFIEQNQAQPFFLYLPFNTPHSPMQVPDAYWERFRTRELAMKGGDKEKIDFTRAALAMVENIDWNVGRLTKRLSDLKLDDNTIVVFFCDNGPASDRWNGGMKGRKGSTDEGGVRSPLFIRWPGKIEAGRLVTQIAGAIDLLPTLTDLARVPVHGNKPLDGQSLSTLLDGTTPSIPGRTLFSTWAGKVSARSQQFRLDERGQLFDMTADPGQKRDVSTTYKDIADDLREQVNRFRQDVLAELGTDDRPFPVGHRDFNFTQLPARDGNATGAVRSAKAPNCSYFTKWTSTADVISWDIEVLNAGRYAVEILYACPKKDIGSEFELRFKDAKLLGAVTQPHDPPARGNEHDRVPRDSESLVKDFAVMSVGDIDLPAGRDKLKLQATTVSGGQVMEVRGVHLIRR